MAWDPTVPAEGAALLSAPIRENFEALDALMTGGGGVTFPLLAPDGSAAAPSYAFSAASTTGLYHAGFGTIGLTSGGTMEMLVGNGAINLNQFRALGWMGPGGVDVGLARDAAGILAQKNGANLQKFRVYGDATNYTEITGVAGLTTTVVNGSGVATIVALTQAAYDALTPKVATTLYVITP